MKINVLGAGYVGLVTGACFAEMGNNVTCVDIDEDRVARLKQAIMPIYEPRLETMVKSNMEEGRLAFSSTISDSEDDIGVYFIAVGTPPGEQGAADLHQVFGVAREIGRRMNNRYNVIVDKSTVPVGTADRVRAVIAEEVHSRGARLEFDVISNPEFLKEGDAIEDFMRPDRVVVGSDSTRATDIMRELYAPFIRSHERMIVIGPRDAEMTKYAANALLATKISFMNEIANLSERLGVDIENVRLGIGADTRIGFHFIYPGCGYGGSCFPKDVKALIHMAAKSGVDAALLNAVDDRNNRQKHRLFEKIVARLGPDLSGKTFAVWGLAFKPGTDDMREAPSLVLIEHLLAAGAKVQAHDPVANDAAAALLPHDLRQRGRISFHAHQYEALEGADALALVTEWKPFRNPDFKAMGRTMGQRIIFDGRNQYDPKVMEQFDFEYFGIGRGLTI